LVPYFHHNRIPRTRLCLKDPSPGAADECSAGSHSIGRVPRRPLMSEVSDDRFPPRSPGTMRVKEPCT
jgi:hypothetical protein